MWEEKKTFLIIRRMKWFFLIPILCCNLCASLPLLDDYHKAREIALVYERPVVMVLVPKGEKGLNEIIQNEIFAELMGKDLVFVKNEVPTAPTVVLLDKDEREIARVGYQGQSPEEFAGFLKEKLSLYQKLLLDYENAKSKEELEALYEQALTLGSRFYREKILEKGLALKEGTFFLLERYVSFVNQGKRESREAKEIRARIEAEKDIHARIRLLLIDFQESGEREPLDAYITGAGEKDPSLERIARIFNEPADN